MRDIVLTAFVFAMLPVCLVRPWIGILMWSWLGYMNPHRLTWGFAFTMPFAQLIAVTTLIGFVFTKARAPLPRVREIYLLLGLWAVFTVSTQFALYPESAWDQLTKVSKIFFMTLITISLCQESRKVHALVWVIAMSLGFFGLKGGIWAVLTGAENQVLGPAGSFIEGNTEIGLALVMNLPLLLYVRREEKRGWLRLLLIIMFGFSTIAIVGTYSRGALLGLLVVLAVLVLKSRARVLAVVLLLVGILLVTPMIPEKWFARMDTINTYEQDGSAMARLTVWYAAWQLGLEHPMLGGGFKTFDKAVINKYVPEWNLDTDAHNIFFQILGEHGFTGLALYLALTISTLLSLRRLERRTRHEPTLSRIHNLSQLVQVSLVGYMVSGFFLGLCYFDLFYHLVAITIILKQLALAGERVPTALATEAPPTSLVRRPSPWGRPALGSG